MKFTSLGSLGLMLVLAASLQAAPPAGIFDKKKPAAPAPAPAAQPRPQPAPVAQPRPQPAPQPAPVAQPRPQPTPQPAPVARPQQQPQPQSAPVPSVPSQFIRPQSRPQAQPQPQPAPTFQPQQQPQTGLRAQPQTQPRPQSQPQPQHDDHRHNDHNALRGQPSSKQVIVNGIIRSLVNPQRDYDYDHDHHNHFGSPRGRGGYYGPGYLPAPYYVSPQYVQPIIVQPQYVDPGVRIVPRADTAPPQPERLVVPTLDQFAEIPDPSQQDFLLHAINSLETDLNGMSTGESWKKHLQLSTIASLLDDKDNGTDSVRRERLGQIGSLFDTLDQDSKYRQVSELWGFDTLRVGLRAYSAPAEIRLRKQIGGAADALSYALNNVDTGEGWKKHLQLEFLTTMSPATDANRAGRIQQTSDLLVRFDGVATDESFRVISSKPGFAEARDMLKKYVQALKGDSRPDAPTNDVAPPQATKEDTAPPKEKRDLIELPKAEASEPPQPEDK